MVGYLAKDERRALLPLVGGRRPLLHDDKSIYERGGPQLDLGDVSDSVWAGLWSISRPCW